MKWIVNGVDRETAAERTIRVDAMNRDEAADAASRNGVLAADIQADHADKIDAKIPRYDGLALGTFAFGVIALLWLALAAIVMVLFFIGKIGASAELILYALGCVLSAFLFLAAAGACTAIRDIAINSWKR
jgi:hypothetical protein